MQMSEAATKLFTARAAEAVSREPFHRSLSGGRPPSRSMLSSASPLHLADPLGARSSLLGDERCVPPTTGQQLPMTREFLLDHVPIRRPTSTGCRERWPRGGRARYEKELREFFSPHGDGFPVFDFILLGLGEDGTRFSLPGTRAIREAARWVLGHYVDAQKAGGSP